MPGFPSRFDSKAIVPDTGGTTGGVVGGTSVGTSVGGGGGVGVMGVAVGINAEAVAVNEDYLDRKDQDLAHR